MHVGLVRCNWTKEEVDEMAERIPTLKKATTLISHGCGIGVYRSSANTKDRDELKAMKKGNKKLDWLD